MEQYNKLLVYEAYIRDLLLKELSTKKTKTRALHFVNNEIAEAEEFLQNDWSDNDKVRKEVVRWLKYLQNLKSQLEKVSEKRTERRKRRAQAKRQPRALQLETMYNEVALKKSQLKEETKKLRKRSSDILKRLRTIRVEKKKRVNRDRKRELLEEEKRLKQERREILARMNAIKTELKTLEPRIEQIVEPKTALFKARLLAFIKITEEAYQALSSSKQASCLKRRIGGETEYYHVAFKDKHITVDAKEDFTKYNKKRIYYDDPDFNEVRRVITMADNIRGTTAEHIIASYIDLFIVYDIELTQEHAIEPFDIENEEIMNSDNNYNVMFKYIQYEFNPEAKGFKDMFANLEETQTNDKANSCFINLIVNTYKDQIGKRRTGAYKKDELTHESLCRLMKVECKDQDLGITLKQSEEFFKHYKLGLVVVDLYCKTIFQVPRTSTYNNKIFPQTLYILVHNNHCYRLNCDENSFVQILSSNAENKGEIDKLKNSISNKYQFQNYEKNQDVKVVFIQQLDDVVQHIRENPSIKIRFIIESPIDKVVFEMLDKKYEPYVNYTGGRIVSLMFKVGKIKYTIQNALIETDHVNNDVDEVDYSNYMEADKMFYEWLVNKDFLSRNSPQTEEIDKLYRNAPLVGNFKGKPMGRFNSVDRNKSYTSLLMEMKFIPVFSTFDEFKPYDGHALEDYTQYLVKVEQNQKNAILFEGVHSKCYGYVLNKITRSEFEVLYYRRPSNLIESNAEGNIRKLWDAKISDDSRKDTQHKKNIANVVIGKLEKRDNKCNLCRIYQNEREAHYYAKVYDGELHEINDYEFVPDEDEESEDAYVQRSLRKIHLLQVKKQVKLCEGFVPIKDFIYNLQRYYLYQVCDQLEKNGLTPLGTITDSVLVNADEQTLNKIFHFNKEIGGYKFEKDKVLRDKCIELHKNDLIDIQTVKVNEIPITNEYDKDEIKTILQSHNNVLIKGLYAGVGKTTATGLASDKILYITPYNKLCQSLRRKGFSAITLCKLLNLNFKNMKYVRKTEYDVSGFDCIVFDEIFMHDPRVLGMIKSYMHKHSNMKFIATGDLNQLMPFGYEFNNVQNVGTYMTECVDALFPNQITLKENKRLTNAEDKQRLVNLKNDIFDLKQNIMDVFRKYDFKVIKDLSELRTTVNISYFKFRTKSINLHVQKNMVQVPTEYANSAIDFTYWNERKTQSHTYTYYPGQEIVCKIHYQGANNARLFVNYTYKILGIDKKKITVCDAYDEDERMTFNLNILRHFQLPYCNTCHSVQGLTVEDAFTIFDCNTPYVDRNFIWTAITRATDFKNITIFEHSEEECAKLEVSKKHQKLALKVKNYKSQDTHAGRKFTDKEYVDVAWIQSQKQCCFNCGINFYFKVENGEVETNLSVDRINNAIAHVKNNSRLCCVSCNVARK